MKPLNIVVVDDEPDIGRLIKDALSRHGHSVTCAENGVEALALLAQDNADIVFLDIRMPKGDGLTTLKEIRKLWPSMPVVIITGCGRRDMIDEALGLGSFACLIKPFSIRDVLGLLKAVEGDQHGNTERE